MAATFESIEKEIKNGDLKPVYLLKGEELYYLELLSGKFEQEVLDEAEKDFNMSVFYGKDASMDEVVLSAKQYPVMAKHRLVMLKEAQTMDKRELEKMSKYLQSPLSSTVFVIVNNAKEFPQSLTTKIGKVGTVFESQKIWEEKLVSWIDTFVKQKGFVMEQQASMMVAEYLGNNLMKISNEISKLLINIKDRKEIKSSDVSSHIGISKDYNVFELQKAIGKLDYEKINKCVCHMAAHVKENPLPVVFANLFTYFVKLLVVAQLPDKSDASVASAIKVPSFFARDYAVPAQKYGSDKIMQNISLIREYELKSKGVGFASIDNEGELLKELVYKLTH